MDTNSGLQAWRDLLGAEKVFDAAAAAAAYGIDASGIERRLAGALRPSAADSIPDILRIANQYRIPLYPISTGRNWGYGTALPAQNDCMILDLGDLRGIDFDPELGIVTLEPGVSQGMLAEFLDAGGHDFLVPVTGAGPECSLIGNAVERGYGITPFVDHFGAVTDLEAVLADGTIYRTALREAAGEELARLFKWGIGPYSAGLFTQSNFGVVTRMSILLARKPECVKVCLFSLKDDALLERGVAAIRNILAKLPGIVGAVNLMNQHRVLAMSAPFPSGELDAHGMIPQAVIDRLGRQYQIFPWTGFGTLYGTQGVVAAAQRTIRRELSGIASRLMFLSPAQAAGLASLTKLLPGAMGRRLAGTVDTLAKSLELVAGRPNYTAMPLCYWRNPNPPGTEVLDPARDGCGLIWYAPLVPMRPKTVRAYVDMVDRVARKHGVEPLITFTSVSDKVFDSTVPLIFAKEKVGAGETAFGCYKDLLETGRPLGCFPYRVGIDTMGRLAELAGGTWGIHARLRAALDPQGILAPGRYS
jgi:4-cresol dehydrogenase (hydroxylating) flavoprotein subunit